MLGTLLVIARMCAGGFFVWTGSAKLSRSRHFWSQIMGYKIVGPRQARLLAAALPPVEFVAGLFFAAGLWPAVTGCVLLLLLAAFTAAIASSLLRGLENDCGCAGSDRVSPLLIVRNVMLPSLAVAGMSSAAPAYSGEIIVVACGCLLVVVISSNSYRAIGR